MTFDAAKYVSGLDHEGNGHLDSTRSMQEKKKELGEFDAKKLETLLRSSFFHYYCEMICRMDAIGVRLSSGMESRPCHCLLLRGLKDYVLRRVFGTTLWGW